MVLRSLVLFINNLARSAGQLGQNETIFIRACASAVGLSKGINFFLIPTLAKVDSAGSWGWLFYPTGIGFLHKNGASITPFTLASPRCKSRRPLYTTLICNFQYQKEVARLVFGQRKEDLGHKMLSFARQWMKFVMTKCERGRGTRPRYATYPIIPFATLETRRELEPKCVPRLFLGLLQGTCYSAIGQFFFPVLASNSLRSLGES